VVAFIQGDLDRVKTRQILEKGTMRAYCPFCPQDLDGCFEKNMDDSTTECVLSIGCPDEHDENCFMSGYTIRGIRIKFF
jgi:hypothetical protein